MKAVAKQSHPTASVGSGKVGGVQEQSPQGYGAKAGVVELCIGAQRTGIRRTPKLAPGDLIRQIESGLAVRELEDLRGSLDLTMDKLATILGMSKATLHRRKATGKLDVGESDRVVRLARLLGKAVEVFEDLGNARKWLNSPQVGLGGAVPLDYAATEVGAREVEDLLGRIEYGVYS